MSILLYFRNRPKLDLFGWWKSHSVKEITYHSAQSQVKARTSRAKTATGRKTNNFENNYFWPRSGSALVSAMTMKMEKPPNIAAVTDDEDVFKQIKSQLEKCLGSNNYDIQHMSTRRVKDEPWKTNVALAITYGQGLPLLTKKVMVDYFTSGGKLLCVISDVDEHFLELKPLKERDICTELSTPKVTKAVLPSCTSIYDIEKVKLALKINQKIQDQNEHTVMLGVTHEQSCGQAILSRVDLINGDSLPDNGLTQGIVLSECLASLGMNRGLMQVPPCVPYEVWTQGIQDQKRFLQWVKEHDQDGFMKVAGKSIRVSAKGENFELNDNTELGLVFNTEQQKDTQEYWKTLTTHTLGRTLMFARVVGSTMDIVDALKDCVPAGVGLVAVGDHQTQGRGRGSNAWLSPPGCAMFSLHIPLSFQSQLGQRVTLLQHMISLAVIEAVRAHPGYEPIASELRLKWPNDIYFQNRVKIGGVLVKMSVMGTNINANIGCGVNTANSRPTLCLNDIIAAYNQQTNSKLDAFSTLEMIAGTLNQLERLIDLVAAGGLHQFIERYLQAWLHTDQVVVLKDDETRVTIKGIDEYGYLQALDSQQVLHSLHPDGNSFDMTKNLIIKK